MEEEELALGLVELDGAHHGALFPPQRNDQRGAEFAAGMDSAAVGDEVAVGIDHLVVLDRLEGVPGVDGGARQVVILADADKGEQLLPIGDGHCADPGLLVENAAPSAGTPPE